MKNANVKMSNVEKLTNCSKQMTRQGHTQQELLVFCQLGDTKSLLKLLTAQIDFRMISGVTDTLMGSVKFIGCTLQ